MRIVTNNHRLSESLIMWWIIIVIDIKGLLETRAFFFTPFLYVSTLISLIVMLLQASRPHTHTLPGVIRLPEGNGTLHPNENPPSILIRSRDRVTELIRGWNLNLRKVVIIGVTLGTQLGLFIVLMVMKNNWIQYQQPRGGELSIIGLSITYSPYHSNAGRCSIRPFLGIATGDIHA